MLTRLASEVGQRSGRDALHQLRRGRWGAGETNAQLSLSILSPAVRGAGLRHRAGMHSTGRHLCDVNELWNHGRGVAIGRRAIAKLSCCIRAPARHRVGRTDEAGVCLELHVQLRRPLAADVELSRNTRLRCRKYLGRRLREGLIRYESEAAERARRILCARLASPTASAAVCEAHEAESSLRE